MNDTLQQETQTQARPATQEYITPEVNVYETQDGYLLEAEMPGVGKDGLEITVEDRELSIVGRRTAGSVEGEALFCECRTADYRRVFQLDPAIDTDKINARISQGLLTLTLPKSEAVKPRKITVE